MFKISKETRQKLLNYLKTRPFQEVFLLIPLLVELKPDPNGKEKEDWKEAKGLDKIPKPVKKES